MVTGLVDIGKPGMCLRALCPQETIRSCPPHRPELTRSWRVQGESLDGPCRLWSRGSSVGAREGAPGEKAILGDKFKDEKKKKPKRPGKKKITTKPGKQK